MLQDVPKYFQLCQCLYNVNDLNKVDQVPNEGLGIPAEHAGDLQWRLLQAYREIPVVEWIAESVHATIAFLLEGRKS